MVLYQRFARSASAADWRRWANYFSLGTLAGGVTLGVGSVFLMPASRLDMQLLVLLLVCACSSGAVIAFGVYLRSFYIFLLPSGILPVAWLLARGDTQHEVLGATVALWFLALAELARRFSTAFQESAQLRFENEDLVEDLRREKAAAEEANAAKSRFLAAASHDLRQPVHALTLFVAALRPRTTDAEACELLDHMDGSIHAMGSLFGGLLDISRLDAGVVEINRLPFALQPILERICRDCAGEAQKKGVELQVCRTTVVVDSDPILLERVLRNIIVNAVAYTDRGRVLVGCRRGQRVTVQVLDTGRGIPAEEQQHVFQEFYQLGNLERDRTKGVGLGLAIVKRLTTLLDHPLTLASIPGKGSRFQIEIPYAKAAAIAAGVGAEIVAPPVANGSGLILVVDDEPAIQSAMRSLLQSWGYAAIATGSCEEMLVQLATQRQVPRLIICDYRLRERENGVSVIERLRSEYNDEIPGMLITGDTAPDRLKEAQESGFLLLHKPVPNSKLRAAITHLTLAQADPASADLAVPALSGAAEPPPVAPPRAGSIPAPGWQPGYG
jgi:signal transduction histidine kinase/CheY-like chemotaxis protein